MTNRAREAIPLIIGMGIAVVLSLAVLGALVWRRDATVPAPAEVPLP